MDSFNVMKNKTKQHHFRIAENTSIRRNLTQFQYINGRLVGLLEAILSPFYLYLTYIYLSHTVYFKFELTECGSVHGDGGVHFTANWKVLVQLLNVHLWTSLRQNQTALIVSFSRHDLSFIYSTRSYHSQNSRYCHLNLSRLYWMSPSLGAESSGI